MTRWERAQGLSQDLALRSARAHEDGKDRPWGWSLAELEEIYGAKAVEDAIAEHCLLPERGVFDRDERLSAEEYAEQVRLRLAPVIPGRPGYWTANAFQMG